MGIKHFQNTFSNEDEPKISEYTEKMLEEGKLLSVLTKGKTFSIIKHIIDELILEYIEKATNDKDYAPMYGRESLIRLLEIIESKVSDANSYLNQES
jgi:uncharacterized protein YaaR (DUF327 family)